MVLMPDYTIICLCNKGYIQVHGFSSPRLNIFQLDPPADINDIEMCYGKHIEGVPTEYAIATDNGLYFISHLVGGNYSINQLSDPIHRNSDKIKCLSVIRENIFLLGVHGCPDLVIFDRL